MRERVLPTRFAKKRTGPLLVDQEPCSFVVHSTFFSDTAKETLNLSTKCSNRRHVCLRFRPIFLAAPVLLKTFQHRDAPSTDPSLLQHQPRVRWVPTAVVLIKGGLLCALLLLLLCRTCDRLNRESDRARVVFQPASMPRSLETNVRTENTWEVRLAAA